MSFSDQIKGELRKIRKETDDAISRSGGDMEAGLRVGFEAVIRALPKELEAVRGQGFEVDGGSYFLGSMLMAIVSQGVNPHDVFKHPALGPLFREYYEKARAL